METQQRKRSVVTLLLLLILFGKGNDKWLYSKVFLMVSFHSSKLQYVSCQRHPFYSWPNSKCKKNCSKITLKLSHLNFHFWHFSLTFFLLKLTCLVTLFDSKLQVLKTRQTGPLFCFVHSKCKHSSLRSRS